MDTADERRGCWSLSIEEKRNGAETSRFTGNSDGKVAARARKGVQVTEPCRLSLEHIERAAEIIDPVFLNSPSSEQSLLSNSLIAASSSRLRL